MDIKLKPYQTEAYLFMLKKEKAGLFLEMGLGKTIITLLVIQTLLKTKKIKKCLIITSLRIANNVWKNESEKWDLKLNIKEAVGDYENRIQVLKSESDVIVTTKDFTHVFCKKEIIENFDCIVFDESSYFKNTNTMRFREIRKKISLFKYIYILSGTPCTEDLISLWSQIYLLDKGERLYKAKTKFINRFFNTKNFLNYSKHYPMEGSYEEIFKRINDIVYIKTKECEGPEIIDYFFELDKEMKSTYKHMLKNSYVKEIICTNGISKLIKLNQICNGGIYDKEGNFNLISYEKVKNLVKIVNGIEDNIIIVIKYNFDFEMIKKYLPNALKFEDSLIEDWNCGKIKILVIHPKSCGHGLNLQFGGSTLIWYSLTYSLEQYLQVNARIYRTGQENKVKIIRMIGKRTLEEDIKKVLEKKLTLNNFFLTYKI